MIANTAITGAAGAFFVAAELSRREWMASLTWGNAPRTDVLAQRLEPPQAVAIQVKAKRGAAFRVGAGAEEPAAPDGNEWYVFVDLGSLDEPPGFFVVPRDHIAAMSYIGHRAQLRSPGRGGRERKDSSQRNVEVEQVEGYRDAWGLLDEHASRAPRRLPQWVWDWHAEIPLPAGHPELGQRSADRG